MDIIHCVQLIIVDNYSFRNKSLAFHHLSPVILWLVQRSRLSCGTYTAVSCRLVYVNPHTVTIVLCRCGLSMILSSQCRLHFVIFFCIGFSFTFLACLIIFYFPRPLVFKNIRQEIPHSMKIFFLFIIVSSNSYD